MQSDWNPKKWVDKYKIKKEANKYRFFIRNIFKKDTLFYKLSSFYTWSMLGLFLATLILTSVYMYNFRMNARIKMDQSENRAIQSIVDKETSSAWYTAEIIGESIRNLMDKPVETRRRFMLSDIIQEVMLKSQNVTSAYICMEKDVLDGKDKEYQNDLLYGKEGRASVRYIRQGVLIVKKPITPKLAKSGLVDDTDWYSEVKKTHKPVIVGPKYSEDEGRTLTFAYPLVSGTQYETEFVGVAAVDFSLDKLEAQFREKSNKETYYALFSPDGKFVINGKENDLNGQKFKRYAASENICPDIKNGMGGHVKLRLSGQTKPEAMKAHSRVVTDKVLIVYSPFKIQYDDKNWTIMSITRFSALYKDMLGMVMMIIIIAVIFLIITTMINYFIIKKHVVIPIMEISEEISMMSEFNFSKNKLSAISKENMERKDEIGIIARGVKSMEDNLRQILELITDTTGALGRTAIRLKDVSENAFESVSVTSDVVDKIAKNNETYAHYTIKATDNSETMNTLLVNHNQLVDEMGLSVQNVEKLEFDLNDLMEESLEQINLLIDDLNCIREEGKTPNEKEVLFNNIFLCANHQISNVKKCKSKFEQITVALLETKDVLTKIQSDSIQIKNSSNYFLGFAENISDMALENSAMTQQASASFLEQMSLISQVSSAFRDLLSVSIRLRNEVSKFRINEKKEEDKKRKVKITKKNNRDVDKDIEQFRETREKKKFGNSEDKENTEDENKNDVKDSEDGEIQDKKDSEKTETEDKKDVKDSEDREIQYKKDSENTESEDKKDVKDGEDMEVEDKNDSDTTVN